MKQSGQQLRCDGLSRREAIRAGGLAAFGLGLGNLTQYRQLSAATPAGRAAAKSCILVWLDGGPSHLETFDPKPEAPVEVRGPLDTIPTALPGIRLSECLPGVASRLQDLAIIRSMTSTLGEHNFATHYLLSGFKPTPALEYPSFHSVAASLFDNESTLPSNIAVPRWRVGGSTFSGRGFLPQRFGPFSLEADPAKPDFQIRDLNLAGGVTLDRLQRRRRFVEELEAMDRWAQEKQPAPFQQAFELVTSPEARQAFDLEAESGQLRRAYGLRTVGQSCLLARRLVERGVPLVTVNVGGWDTHENLVTRLKDGFTGAQQPVGLVPLLDQALSALVDDLKQRQLWDQTLVVVMGEFGRTPKLNPAGGRDHWPRSFSVLLGGGGVAGGQIVGASDAVGEGPKERPVTPSDLVATLYRLLGIAPDLELRTDSGRPVRITPHQSQVISELIG